MASRVFSVRPSTDPVASRWRARFALAPLLTLLVPGLAPARGYRIDMVPGGYTFECHMCHSRQAFRHLTVFGLDVRNHLLFADDYPEALPPNFFIGDEGNPDWPALALLDSDGDGYTNGEELGDPDGRFVQADPQPMFPFTRPDLPEEFPCGSGTVEGPEACDGDDLGGQTCADVGFVGGALACDDACVLDSSACHHCGDGVLQGDEICDGPALDGQTCATRGFVGGTLACNEQCGFDPSGCHQCGDGLVQPGETCDGAVPAEVSCAERGLEGEVVCVNCALDYSACVPLDGALQPPDSGSPDIGLSGEDVGPAVPDAAVALDRGLRSDGVASDAIVGEVDALVGPDRGAPGATSESPPAGCAAGGEPSRGLPYLMVVFCLWRCRRTLGRSPTHWRD